MRTFIPASILFILSTSASPYAGVKVAQEFSLMTWLPQGTGWDFYTFTTHPDIKSDKSVYLTKASDPFDQTFHFTQKGTLKTSYGKTLTIESNWGALGITRNLEEGDTHSFTVSRDPATDTMMLSVSNAQAYICPTEHTTSALIYFGVPPQGCTSFTPFVRIKDRKNPPQNPYLSNPAKRETNSTVSNPSTPIAPASPLGMSNITNITTSTQHPKNITVPCNENHTHVGPTSVIFPKNIVRIESSRKRFAFGPYPVVEVSQSASHDSQVDTLVSFAIPSNATGEFCEIGISIPSQTIKGSSVFISVGDNGTGSPLASLDIFQVGEYYDRSVTWSNVPQTDKSIGTVKLDPSQENNLTVNLHGNCPLPGSSFNLRLSVSNTKGEQTISWRNHAHSLRGIYMKV